MSKAKLEHTPPCSAGFYWATNKYGQSVPVQVYADQHDTLWFSWVGSQSPIAVADSDCTWSERIYPPNAQAPSVLQQRDELLGVCKEYVRLRNCEFNGDSRDPLKWVDCDIAAVAAIASVEAERRMQAPESEAADA